MKSKFIINQILIIYLISDSFSIIEYQYKIEPFQEFRGVWVSPVGGDKDLVTFVSEEQFK
jgi:hypothetical protein